MRRLRATLLLALLLAGCGYFNSFYNANRRFAEAERAAARGDDASDAYRESIDRAAASYRSYPDGRWADDALLLIGRARFALGEDAAAAAALRALLHGSPSPDAAIIAHAYLGAALARAGHDSALAHLDIAAAQPVGTPAGSLSRLWRARVLFDRGRDDRAWADLDALHRTANPHAWPAALDAARRAVAARDSVRLDAALVRIAATRATGRSTDPLLDLVDRVAAVWSPAFAFRATAALEDAPDVVGTAGVLALARAQLAARAGDTAAAAAAAMRAAAAGSSQLRDDARLAAARWRLALIRHPDELDDVLALLLPAAHHPDVGALQREILAARVLIARGTEPGTSLSRFAAAELARDELRAPRLARALFLEFASLTPDAAWPGKALLAAAALAAGDEVDVALKTLHDNIYIRTARGGGAGEVLALAEARMARGMAGLRDDAYAVADSLRLPGART